MVSEAVFSPGALRTVRGTSWDTSRPASVTQSVCRFRDRKRKRFVQDGGSQDPKRRKVKTESGTWIPASYKSNLYPSNALATRGQFVGQSLLNTISYSTCEMSQFATRGSLLSSFVCTKGAHQVPVFPVRTHAHAHSTRAYTHTYIHTHIHTHTHTHT